MSDKTTIHLDIMDMPVTFTPVLAEETRRTQWHIRSGLSGYALFYGETPRALLFGTYEECKKTADAMNALQISYRNPEAIESYLAAHPEIEAFLSESWQGLEKHFGKNVSLILEVMTYPGEESYDELVGWIQSTDEIEVGLDKLEAFEEEWLETLLSRVGNTFNFNIEFK